MEGGPLVGIIYGIILLIMGGLGIYDSKYLNNYTAYLLVVLGILSLIIGAYFASKKK
jgi:formate hydrogenlyase subunit 3/multisubunit Na+/H+ antiporter MnhD subunit